MSGFFISYQRKNLKSAQKMRDKLAEAGILYWIDEHIKVGEEWKLVIDKALSDCTGVIVVVTPNALRSQYVTYEWSYALGLGKKVIPVIFEYPNPDPKSPEHLKIHPKLDDRQNRDFSNSRKQPWDELITELKALFDNEYISPEIRQAETDLRGHELTKRKQAIDYLLGVPKQIAQEVFARVIRETQSQDVAVDISLALAQASNYKDVRAINGLARGIENHPKRNDVLDALVTYNSAEVVELFKNVLEQTSEENFRNIIIKYLCRVNHADVIPVLRTLIKDSGNIYGNVVEALCLFAHPDSLPELLIIAQRTDAGTKSRTDAIKAIGKIGRDDTVEKMYFIADSFKILHYKDDFDIFDAVLNTLEAIGGQNAKDLVLKLRTQRRFSERYSVMDRIIRNMQAGITE